MKSSVRSLVRYKILDFDGDMSDTLELTVILSQILNTHYPSLISAV